MPVISFVSSKGGTGKTTTALTLAGAIANAGTDVILLDADPNQPLLQWSELGDVPDGIDVMGGITSDNFTEAVGAASRQAPFVFIDLEGSASQLVALAVVRSDFVIIPAQGSYLDAREAVKALQLIESFEKAADKSIPYGVLFTRTSAAIRGGTLREVERQFKDMNLVTFSSQMMEREAFRLVFSVGGTVFQLGKDDVSGVERAQENATAVAEELISKLPAPKKRRKARNRAA